MGDTGPSPPTDRPRTATDRLNTRTHRLVRPPCRPHLIVALVVIIVVAVAAGAGIEYALNHSTTTGQAPASSAPPASPAITAKVDPAVVDITSVVPDGKAATGMVLTSSGLVLTNNHVIENSTTVNAQVDGTGHIYSATVLGYSITGDVALLRLKGASGLKTVTTAISPTLAVGTSVVAIGNAGGTGARRVR